MVVLVVVVVVVEVVVMAVCLGSLTPYILRVTEVNLNTLRQNDKI
jgi:hypothetical protein